jgi:drug/metabolite transporter (DMT)-like permease
MPSSSAPFRHADPGSVGVIVGCVPLVLALAGPLVARRPVRPRVVAAAVVVSLGAAAVQGAGGSMSLAGFALACEAAFTLVAIPLIASLGARSVSAYACLFAVPLLVLAGVVVDGGHAIPIPTLQQAVALVYMAVVVTALAFVLWYSGVGRLGVERAGLFAGIVPVSALLSAAAIGESPLTPVRLLGATLVAAGVSLGMTTERDTAHAP